LAADFDVTGAADATYSISFSASTVLTGLGADIVVDTFTDSLGGSGVLTGGAESFTAGATLHLGANQTAGVYSGTYTVTVNY
ncbi:MAG: DUF4402 domain-containing protein, partial [Gammaproteobacteria bacterium]|nr:DUF4402 domain-containing protein [Gammaproteobacteria bacterium]